MFFGGLSRISINYILRVSLAKIIVFVLVIEIKLRMYNNTITSTIQL